MLSLPDHLLHSTHRFFALTAALVGLSACGDGGDHAHNFTGTWTGTSAFSANNGDKSSVPFNITSDESNTLRLGNFCADGSGPTATAVSENTFEVQPFECSPEASSTCASVIFKVTSGSGTLKPDGKLSIVLEGVAIGCDKEVPYRIAFTGENMFDQQR